MKPGSEILVSCADRIVWVRVEGNGSSTNSTALRDFAREMIHRDAREFIVDLCNCPVMDSTFMGTLAGIALWLGELGEGCLSVVNLNERNAESLCSLGLDQLFKRTRERHKKGRASSSNTAGRRPHRSGADDVGSPRGLDQDGPRKSPEIQGRHSVPRGRVAFVEIALPPNLKTMRSVV